MNKVLVTGGTGLVGSHLLYTLCSKQIPVRALLRNGSDKTFTKNIFAHYSPEHDSLFSGIEWVEGNINDIVSLETAMQNITHVYHAAALVAFNRKQHTILDKINAEGTANVVNVALDAGISKLVHVSSIAAIGKKDAGNGLLDENSVWKYSKSTSRYSLTKYNAEREVWRGIEEGLNAVIINPGVIIGPCDRNKNTGVLFKNVWNGLNYYTNGRTGFVDVRDVANAMFLLMGSEISAQRFILVGKNATYLEFLTMIANTMNKKPPTREAGRFMVSMARRVENIISKIRGHEPRITRETARSAFSNYSFDGTKITSKTSLSYTSVENTIQNAWNFIEHQKS